MLGHPLSEERLQATGARDGAGATIRTRLSSITESAAIASTVPFSSATTGAIITGAIIAGALTTSALTNSLSAVGTDSHGPRPRLLTAFARRFPEDLLLDFLLLNDVDMAHDIDSLELRNGPDPFTGDFDLL